MSLQTLSPSWPNPLATDPIRALIAYGLLADRPRRDLKIEGPSTAELRERWRKYFKSGETLAQLIKEMRAE